MPKTITSEIFVKRYKVLSPLLRGRIHEIASRAGVDYIRFMNATYGRIKSPELLKPMYEAMEEVAKEITESIDL